ncbi:MAG: hypothetical protein MJ180_01115 [Candidatus Gastranaerophilales bacterium]|nr:hypothetical protein [Candidatus Gastranaerophilales bacterium]
MINLNVDATSLILQSNMKKANNTLQTSLERLATGFRINHASDNAAILAISKNIQSQISGSRVCIDNVQSGYNLVSTADGALGKMQDTAQRIRDLSLEAMSGTYSQQEREMMQAEITQLTQELYSQKNSAKFNEISVFGEPEVPNNPPAETPDTEEAEVPEETTSGEGIQLQVGADSGSENTVTINTEFQLGSYAFDVTTQEAAAHSLEEADRLLDTLSLQRSRCGSTQNLLSDISKSLSAKITNLESSYSSMMDTDVAAETARYTKAQILYDTNAALLAQLNTDKANALYLLTGIRSY